MRAGGSPPRAAATMPAPPDLYALLADAVVRSPAHCARRVAMADSKALYSPAAGLRVLERSVLGALQASAASAGAPPPACLGALIGSTDGDPRQRRRELACHGDDALALPVAAAPADVAAAAAVLHDVGQRCGATLLAMRARLVFPAEFNELCEAHGTKGAALSHTTLALVRRTLDALPDREPQPVHIDLDKHGGRSRYGALLQHHFPEGWIDAVVETRRESRYHWEYRGAPVAATFRGGCEQLLATALAAMEAKDLRFRRGDRRGAARAGN